MTRYDDLLTFLILTKVMCLSKNYAKKLNEFRDLVLGGVNTLVNAKTLIVRDNIYSITTFSYITKVEVFI